MGYRPPSNRSRTGTAGRRQRTAARWRWRLYVTIGLVGPLMCLTAGGAYLYATSGRIIETKLRLNRVRNAPRIFARPLELRSGLALDPDDLVARLNELGYARQARALNRGEFTSAPTGITIVPRLGEAAGRTVHVTFGSGDQRRPSRRQVRRVAVDGAAVDAVGLGAPWLAGVRTDSREKRRTVPLAGIPHRVIQAVLAIEDQRFYYHPGVDGVRMAGALITNLRGDRPYLEGGSTITQQVVKNVFLTPEKTYERKLLEQFMAIVLERRLSKDEILELYLNEVYLGHRGSFAIHGVAEAARLLFGKDVANVTLAEAATLAGLIQSPQTYSPFRAPARALARRKTVLDAMVAAGYVPPELAERAARDALTVATDAVEAEAPHFVDFVAQTLAVQYPELHAGGPLDVYTTLDLHLQRLARDAVARGLEGIERRVAGRHTGRPEAALVAIAPSTGEVLAMVGGRAYARSQFNRAVNARRQPGSLFKPFVYLAAFEHAVSTGTPITPATLVVDEPTRFTYEDRSWEPANFGDEYDGPITLRRALARSRNVPAVKMAETAGYGRVAALWNELGTSGPLPARPSIVLGAFETTPLEMATAYTVFPNLGTVRPARIVRRVVREGHNLETISPAPRRAARADTTFLVTHMMRSVLDEGTGRGARSAGFLLEAAGKSGTTNESRDAWFVGFTPELLTVVWVGLDDNKPLGLSGAEAALPIWTAFMEQALSGRPARSFQAPAGVTLLEIDPQTGERATPGCHDVLREAFVTGTEPEGTCRLHGG